MFTPLAHVGKCLILVVAKLSNVYNKTSRSFRKHKSYITTTYYKCGIG